MAFYYLTKDLTIYKTVGARNVKRMFRYKIGIPDVAQIDWKNVKPAKTPFSSISLPLVRSVFPTLITNDIIKVQPLRGDAGKVFYPDENGNKWPVWRRNAGRHRNTIPIYKFKQHEYIILKSKHFHDIVTELMLHELR